MRGGPEPTDITNLENIKAVWTGNGCAPPKEFRVKEIVDSIFFRKRVSKRTGARLTRTLNRLEDLLSGAPKIWKIGVTTNPVWRWSAYNPKHTKQIWDVMVILDWSLERDSIEMEEAAIIQMYDVQGNRNVASGGEGHKTQECLSERLGRGCWLYVVLGRA